ncbi:MAG: family 20 glycosylhydrolase [Bacteroidales bacterium]|nr:family 20 glycosylhydrolase [Bacteroidales bacterium]
MTKSLLIFALLAANPAVVSDPADNPGTPGCIIPKVVSYSESKGRLDLANGASYAIEGALSTDTDVEVFGKYLEESQLALVKVNGPARKALVRFHIGPKELKGKPAGAYSLSVDAKGVSVKAADVAGAFYAVQSLIQMRNSQDGTAIAACRIEDEPRYQYRGLMLDLVRHFQSKDFVLRQIDMMALLKMNRLHLHLTDNEGWRIELDCAPEMVAEGAFGSSRFFNILRSNNPIGFCKAPEGYKTGTYYDNGVICGGYYSKDDIRDILDYAAARQIVIVPEIELPGHNLALLHVHPEFFCDGAHKVDDVVCPANEKVYDFFEKVIAEVMDIFPSEYIHVGGDEASKENWKLCSRCRKKIESEGLKDVLELQSCMIRRMDKYITSKGRRLIGWDEILEGGLSENATVMSWRGTKGGIDALSMDHDIVMSPNTYYYLDYGQDAPYKEPLAMRPFLPLKTVYDYDPEKEILESGKGRCDASSMHHLLGVQGNMWGEFVITEEHYEYMIYPRTYAIAETGWSPAKSKNYDDFKTRALVFNGWALRNGYHPFDLAGEVGERAETKIEMPRITKGAKATVKIGDQTPKEEPLLVDGFLAGWIYNDHGYWKRTPDDEIVVVVDLGELKDIHYVGAEFMDYRSKNYYLPEDAEFCVSEDGKDFIPVHVPHLFIERDRKQYGVFTVGSPVAVRARFVRLSYNKGKRKVRTGISELIVN